MKNLIINEDYNGIFDYVMNLKKFTIKEKENANGTGIYFLFKDDVITYIGISQNIYNRIFCCITPHINEKDFNGFSFVNIDLINDELEFFEYFLISFFHPCDNKKHRGFFHYDFLNNDYKIKKEEFEEIERYKMALEISNIFNYAT